MSKRMTAWAGLAAAGVLLVAGCGPDATEETRKLRHVRDLGKDEAVEELAQVVNDENEALAIEAVVSLGRAGRSERRRAARRVLYSVADKDERPRVRQAAVRAISRAPTPDEGPRSRQVLRRLAQVDPAPRVRAEACDALGEVGTLEDVEFLVGVATGPNQELIVESRAVAAVEGLLDITFNYDSRAADSERRAALRRIKELAPAIARKYMRHPRGRRAE